MSLLIRGRLVSSHVSCRALRIGARGYAGHNVNATPELALLLRLKDDVKLAMRAKDKAKTNVIKDILSQVVNASKTKTPVESDSQVFSLIRSSILKREESAKSYREHARLDLAETEEKEMRLLEEYMPKQMDEREIQAIVLDLVSSIGAKQSDLGKVLKELATRLDSSVAPKATQARIVKQILASGSSRNVAQEP